MKNEIMSKSEVWVIIALFFGLVSYSIFMFYLLAKRSKGINYFNDLYSVNSFVVYFLFFFMFFLLNQIKKYIRKKEQRIVNFISVLGAFSTGVLLASGFFTIVL
ncbi:hypothetical protein BE1S18E01_29280 [Acinetobacter sp. BEC1-S18-ESBL-01]|jgi:hypothetical protein|uniref:hypothetical protein n=1 Tax=Acinetobacter TaxID=469 RepID=UPI0002D0C07D|nr:MULTISPECIES: hypothetical protein [Acinetobacter]ENW10105.1 hypothetical protein F930_03106 [Acinetobacter pittii ANC 3678]MBD0443841.1 hypothetical protein [Acinetobacter nosocomialis]MCU4472538.1 hypothetical protein [Acinetobacter pittii]MCU4487102.1 hypothetical protein [Acinetobacter pittii]MDQ9042204.1 hypothetical protein [Acinetobacter nosocomialis]